MALEFEMTEDFHTRKVMRNGKRIATIMWHPDAEPRIRLDNGADYLTAREAQECLEEIRKRKL